MHIAKRENVIVNRLNKTKVERQVDHEQERVDRIKAETNVRRAAAAEKVTQRSIFHYVFDEMFVRKKRIWSWRDSVRRRRLPGLMIHSSMQRMMRSLRDLGRRGENWRMILCNSTLTIGRIHWFRTCSLKNRL